MSDITEKIDELSPIKSCDLGVINAHADPTTGCISINIDTDIVTLGVVAKILTHRYNRKLNEFTEQSLVPLDTDIQVQQIVNDYLMRKRENFVLVRKGTTNG